MGVSVDRWLCCVVVGCVVLCCVVLCCVVLCCVVLSCDLLCCVVLCVVVVCAVEQESGEIARREPQDLSVTVELGLCHCSRLPGKVDNQAD